MKTPADVLTRLNALSAEDRTWIIGKLSSQSKSRLLGTPADPPAPATRPPAAASSATPLDVLSRADAAAIVRVLAHEPAWVIAALSHEREWSWRATLLDALTPATRSEIHRIRQSDTSFTPYLIEKLASLVSSRLQERVDARPASPFETLIARLGASRSRKRLTLHL